MRVAQLDRFAGRALIALVYCIVLLTIELLPVESSAQSTPVLTCPQFTSTGYVDFRWQLMGGTGNYVNQPRVLTATPTVPANPGSRSEGVTWTDSGGKLWLFGGQRNSIFANDLWKYDPVTNLWECVMDPAGQSGIYSGETQYPGMRMRANAWSDAAGNLWLFGGIGNGESGSYGNLNDLWKYNIRNKKWTFVGGSKTSNAAGVYDGATPYPGARSSASSWKDSAGSFFLFGGQTVGTFNDLWKFNPVTEKWQFIDIPGTKNQGTAGVYPGGSSTVYYPGGRYSAAAWADTNGNGYVFGGFGTASSLITSPVLNDLWKFDAQTQTWIYLSGSQNPNAAGIYGGAEANRHPGARFNSAAWTDQGGNLWLLGGEGYAGGTGRGFLNDVWQYKPAMNRWVWKSGFAFLNMNSSYSGTIYPGGRYSPMVWDTPTDYAWLYGGWGVAPGSAGRHNDFFRMKNISESASPNTVLTSVNENESVFIEVQNISDPSGIADVRPATTTTLHGTVSKVEGSTNTLFYVPNKMFHGRDSFMMELAATHPDAVCTTPTAPVIIDVIDVNYCPIAEDIAFSLDQDTTAAVPLSGFDPDEDRLSPIIVTNPAHGTLSAGANGTVIYKPATGFTGTDIFTYKYSDGKCQSNESYAVITVLHATACPIANDVTVNSEIGLPMQVPVSYSYPGSEAVKLFIVSHPTRGIARVSPNGELFYTRFFSGTDTLIYRVYDGLCWSNFATVTLEERADNTCPVAFDTTVTVTPGKTKLLPIIAVDTDGDKLLSSIYDYPTSGTASVTSGGQILYTCPADFSGTETFTYRVTDGVCTSNLATITVRSDESNACPVAYPVTVFADADGTAFADMQGSDADGDTLRFSIIAQPRKGTAVINAAGRLSYRANSDFSGSDTIYLTATDGICQSNTVKVTVLHPSRNDCPEAYDVSVSALPNSVVNIPVPTYDVNNDLLTVEIISQPFKGLAYRAGNGSIKYVAGPDFFGTDTLQYTVTDGNCVSSIATVTIRETGDNACPTADNIKVAAAPGDTVFIPVIASDPDGNALISKIVTPPAHGTAFVFPDGRIVCTPNETFSGSDTIQYVVSDGICESVPATITIHNGQTNACPVSENANASLSPTDKFITIRPLATDADFDNLTAIITSYPKFGQALILPSGLIQYVPGPGFPTGDSFRYRVTDGHCVSNESDVFVTNRTGNSPPELLSFTHTPAAVYFDDPVTFSLIAADFDQDALTYLYDYGNGKTGSDGKTVYETTGTYLVRAYVSDGYSTVSTRMVLDVINRPLTDLNNDTLINGMDADNDGDGFPDAIEKAYGTDPWLKRDTPTGSPAGPVRNYRPVFYTAYGLIQKKTNTITWKTDLLIPSHKDVKSTDTKLIANVGGITKVFQLNKKGVAKTDGWQIRATTVKVKGGTNNIFLQFAINKADLDTIVQNSRVNANNRPTQITIDFYYAGRFYSTVQWINPIVK